MGARIDFGRVSALPPLALLSQALPRLTRHQLESVVELLIDRLDAMAPDADLELNGDETDFNGAEDDYQTGCEGGFSFPGCPISDPPEDDLEDWDCSADDGCGPILLHGAIHWGSVDLVPAH